MLRVVMQSVVILSVVAPAGLVVSQQDMARGHRLQFYKSSKINISSKSKMKTVTMLKIVFHSKLNYKCCRTFNLQV